MLTGNASRTYGCGVVANRCGTPAPGVGAGGVALALPAWKASMTYRWLRGPGVANTLGTSSSAASSSAATGAGAAAAAAACCIRGDRPAKSSANAART